MIKSIYEMANAMFEQHGMPVHVFLRQPLTAFARMRNTQAEQVYYIDQVE